MARKPHDTFEDQRKAGNRRKRDGHALIAQGKYRGGMYLLGYAIECSLKSYIMGKCGVAILQDAEARLRTDYGLNASLTSGHDLEEYYGVAEKLGLTVGADTCLLKARGEVFRWRYHWRYDHREPRHDDAIYFGNMANTFYDWITSRI